MPDVSIRPYRERDPVAAIHEAAMRDAGGYVEPDDVPDGVELDADLRDVPAYYPAGAFLVAVVGDRAVGTGAYRPVSDGVAEITRLRVLPAFQGRGIGRRLLRRVEAVARDRGYREFVLDTAPALAAARALYESEGYVAVGRVDAAFATLVVYRKT